MNLKYNLSETELEIMKVLWEKKEFIKTRELLDLFNEKGKDWKRQTLNTFLIRLEEMNLVVRDRSVVKASGTRTDYEKMQSRDVLDKFYSGDIANFCMALTGNEHISEKDRRELHNFIQKLAEE